MPFIIADRVKETSTTTGTGSITLAGAVVGYQAFDTPLNTGDTTYYTIADQGGSGWEVGIGTFTSPSTLSRSMILSSSNSGSAVTFGAGTKDVFISLPAMAATENNVKQYGATGNGATNDTTAIQNAINASTGSLYFPPGTYLVNTLTLKEGLILYGAGPQATLLLCAANSTTIFNYLAASSIKTGFGVVGMRLLSNSKTGCVAINIDGNTSAIRCSQIRIDNLNMEGTFTTGINLRFCANNYISNVFSASVVDGIKIDNCADTDIVSCKIQSGSGYGFYINGGAGAFDEGVRLTSCSTNGQNIGLAINGQDWGDVASSSFTTCPNGALIIASGTNWKFAACEFAPAGSPATTAAIQIDGSSSGISFSSCQVSNATFGAVVSGELHSFTGCYFTANSNVDLYLSNSLKVSVTGNVMNSTGEIFSVLEFGAANYTACVGNVTNGTLVLVGAGSIAANNVTY
jgi:hypothetical protein